MIPRESLISQFNCKFVALGQMQCTSLLRSDVVAYGFKGLHGHSVYRYNGHKHHNIMYQK